MQKYKIQKTCNRSHRRPNYTNSKSKSTNRNYASITRRLFTSIATSSNAVRRSKKNETGKLSQNKLTIAYANTIGIKYKMQSLK